jgi:hypothetical protein
MEKEQDRHSGKLTLPNNSTSSQNKRMSNISKKSLLSRSASSSDSNGMYTIKDGVRHVVPYIYEFATFAKGRWIGRDLLHVVNSEFGGLGYDNLFWTKAIENGHIKINGNIVTPTYKIKNSDYLTRRTHRHEPPVFGEIEILAENADMLAINKPASLPMHACGAYHFNSLVMLLRSAEYANKFTLNGAAHEHGATSDHQGLHIVHRLDRVTSGVVVLAKDKNIARKLSDQIQSRDTKKVSVESSTCCCFVSNFNT